MGESIVSLPLSKVSINLESILEDKLVRKILDKDLDENLAGQLTVTDLLIFYLVSQGKRDHDDDDGNFSTILRVDIMKNKNR